MLKNISLLKKFVFGFGLILILLMTLAMIGYNGLTSVVNNTRIAQSVSEISNRLSHARISVQAYIINRKAEDAQIVHQTMKAITAEISDTLAQVTDTDVKQQLTAIETSMTAFSSAFDAYAELVNEQSEQLLQMREKAQFALNLTAQIRDRENNALEKIRQNSAVIVAEKTALIDAATEIHNTSMEAKVRRVHLMNNNAHSSMIQWQRENKRLNEQVVKLQPQLKTEEAKKKAARILEQQKLYIDSVIEYSQTLQPDDLSKMISTVKGYARAISSLQFKLRQQLDFFIEDTQTLIDQKLTLTQTVNAIANSLMTAQLHGKDAVALHDVSFYKAVQENLEGIYAVEGTLKAQIEDEQIHNQIAPIIAAIDVYKTAFERVVELINRQHQAELQMISSAQQVDQLCASARATQQEKTDHQIARSNGLMLIGTLAAITLGIVFAAGSALIVVAPVKKAADMFKDIAQGDGDLTKRLDVARSDEIGQMAGWFNAFITKLHDIVSTISAYFETVSASANQLLIISKQMDRGVRNMGDKSATVTKAAEEMSQNMNSVAAASEQAATNVELVASSIEEMNRTASTIGDSSLKARSVTSRAVEEAREASEKVDQLGNAAEEISKVTQVITEISDQTNLLALNATIEAARAGEAGKGFAVVANEIKDLAHQTAEATKGIKVEIEGIQTSTAETVADISRIADVIGEVDDIVSGIVGFVDTQTNATLEITENVKQASAGIADVNQNVAQSSQFAGEIANDIAEVNQIAGSIAENSAQVSTNSGDLTNLADDLKDMIGQFKVERSVEDGLVATADDANMIVWDESFEFAIHTIDKQHHHLVRLINKLHHAMRQRSSQSVMATILNELVDYTVRHFKVEEAMMEKAGYGDLENHQQIHKKLIAEVQNFKQRLQSGDATISMDLMTFLKDWLIDHIDQIDRKYVAVVTESELGRGIDSAEIQSSTSTRSMEGHLS